MTGTSYLATRTHTELSPPHPPLSHPPPPPASQESTLHLVLRLRGGSLPSPSPLFRRITATSDLAFMSAAADGGSAAEAEDEAADLDLDTRPPLLATTPRDDAGAPLTLGV